MNGLLVHLPATCLSPVKFSQDFHNHRLYPSQNFRSRAYPRLHCTKNEDNQNVSQGFSVLKSDNRYDRGNLWSSMAFYLFSVHVPLSFGGLSAVTSILHCAALDPQTEALSLVVLQTVELIGVLLLLRYSGKRPYKLHDFFQDKQSIRERNWLLASALGFGLLVLLVLVTSLIADMLIGSQQSNLKGNSFEWSNLDNIMHPGLLCHYPLARRNCVQRVFLDCSFRHNEVAGSSHC